MLPLSRLAVPDPRFFEASGPWSAIIVVAMLNQPDIADHGHVIAQVTDVWSEHGCLRCSLGPLQFEVKAMKRHSFDEMPTSFRLERR